MHKTLTRAGAALAATLALGACASSSLGSSTSSSTPVPSSGSSGASTTGGSSTSSGPTSTYSTASTSASTPASSSASAPASSSATSSGTASAGTAADDALAALRDGDLSSFVTALQASGMVGDLEARPLTIFAPNNTAFAALPSDTLKSLLADPAKIAPILKNHVVAGTWTAEKLSTVTSLTSLSGRTLAVSSAGGVVTVDGAKVVRADPSSRDLQVHVIDRVLTGSAG